MLTGCAFVMSHGSWLMKWRVGMAFWNVGSGEGAEGKGNLLMHVNLQCMIFPNAHL